LFRIKHISLFQFRNYHQSHFDLTERIAAICGPNGSGKTNLLDAIHFLCFTKGYFNKTDAQSVEQGTAGFNITGQFETKGTALPVSVILRENNKKELWVEKEMVTPFSNHIGKLPLVFIAPDDIILITGASEERRRNMDTILSQTDHEYLVQLIRYNKCLLDRNKYLKNLDGSMPDEILLDGFDDQLAKSGIILLKKRISFLEGFLPKVKELYAYISSEKEEINLFPSFSTLPENYLQDLHRNRSRDIYLQRTAIGIHKDDIEVTMKANPFKQMASQGQKKSLLFAIKLAEFEWLKQYFGFPPILLLDDIFEKLDQERLLKLLDWVGVKNDGQVIMTDTHASRIKACLDEISLPYQLITT
jgi:DNA replication and repair protein RecF